MPERDRCPWCGAEGPHPPAGERRVRCAACGVQRTWPAPDAAELDRAYGGAYRPGSGRFAGPGDAVFARTRAVLAARVDRRAPPGTVVDVGAGPGHLVDALRRRGRPVVGLEREPARDDLRDVALEDLERPDGGAAAVVLWHVLEHLPQPRATLRAARALLRPGGLLVLACPNAASLQARWFGDAWLAWDLPRHLVHLTPEALRAGLHEDGWSVERRGHLRAGQSVVTMLDGLVGEALGSGGGTLYDALRRPEARTTAQTPARRAAVLAAGTALLAPAAALAAGEAARGRGGGIYLEARRGPDVTARRGRGAG